MFPRGAEKGSKTIPNRKSNEKAHQDEHMTVVNAPGGGGTPSLVPPYGDHLGAQNGPKTEPKTFQK